MDAIVIMPSALHITAFLLNGFLCCASFFSSSELFIYMRLSFLQVRLIESRCRKREKTKRNREEEKGKMK